MARIEGKPSIAATIIISLTEAEAGALDALAGYGTDQFLEAFYQKLGKSYLQPHESGLRSLFASVRTGDCSVENILRRAEDARKVFDGRKVARDKETS